MVDLMETDQPAIAKQIWVEKAIGEAVFSLERIDKL
jgi:hypothetical protein